MLLHVPDQDALETLGDDQKVAVLLSKFEELSYAEIAEVMGRSEAAVKSLLARARMKRQIAAGELSATEVGVPRRRGPGIS